MLKMQTCACAWGGSSPISPYRGASLKTCEYAHKNEHPPQSALKKRENALSKAKDTYTYTYCSTCAGGSKLFCDKVKAVPSPAQLFGKSLFNDRHHGRVRDASNPLLVKAALACNGFREALEPTWEEEMQNTDWREEDVISGGDVRLWHHAL